MRPGRAILPYSGTQQNLPNAVVITADGLGEKTLIERENRWLIDRGLPTTQMQVKRIREAFAAYDQQKAIHFVDDRQQAYADLVRDYLAGRRDNPHQSRFALAHRCLDVRAINDAIREWPSGDAGCANP